jgi:hypothetical protein
MWLAVTSALRTNPLFKFLSTSDYHNHAPDQTALAQIQPRAFVTSSYMIDRKSDSWRPKGSGISPSFGNGIVVNC